MTFVVSDGWMHIFPNCECVCRWIFSEADNEITLIHIQQEYNSWREATDDERADVQDSLLNLNFNREILDEPDGEITYSCNKLPSWAKELS